MLTRALRACHSRCFRGVAVRSGGIAAAGMILHAGQTGAIFVKRYPRSPCSGFPIAGGHTSQDVFPRGLGVSRVLRAASQQMRAVQTTPRACAASPVSVYRGMQQFGSVPNSTAAACLRGRFSPPDRRKSRTKQPLATSQDQYQPGMTMNVTGAEQQETGPKTPGPSIWKPILADRVSLWSLSSWSAWSLFAAGFITGPPSKTVGNRCLQHHKIS